MGFRIHQILHILYGVQMYPLSGAIQSPNVKVAMVQPETQQTASYAIPANASFSSAITTVDIHGKGLGQ